jgi:predicted nucleic acid-binding protein
MANPSAAFLDTNVLLYLLSGNSARADAAEAVLAAGGQVSVQVLNEYASVAQRKLGLSWVEIRETLAAIRRFVQVKDLTLRTHEQAVDLAHRYRLGFYDALIVASALEAECRTLYSEDFQAGQRFGRQLVVVNPFRGQAAR